MKMAWKLGRFADIDVFVHYTFLIVLLPGFFGGLGSPLMVLAVFGCVLLHEYGHALAARRYGIRTIDITLYPIGGVARLERMPRAPGAELVIALAGPAVNFAIVALLAILGLFSLEALHLDLGATSFLTELGVVNLILGVFNLVPAFPMDGGRVLRALLCTRFSRAQATTIAARVGRFLALLFGIVGLLSLSLLQVALAAFIYLASKAEETQAQVEERRRLYGADPAFSFSAPPGYVWVDRGGGLWQLIERRQAARPVGGGGPPWV